MAKQKILIICYSNHAKEPRLLMQCRALKNNYDVVCAGNESNTDADIPFIKLTGKKKEPLFSFHLKLNKILRAPFSLLNKIHFYLSGSSMVFSNEDFDKLKDVNADLIICHHPATLDLAFELKKRFKCPVIFNAHEIYAREFEEDPKWMSTNFQIIEGTLQKYLHQCSAVFTVNQEICDYYKQQYKCECYPVHNSRPFQNLKSREPGELIKIIHHGGAMPQRKLEQMAEAVIPLRDRYSLTFMLVNTNPAYLTALKEKYSPQGVIFEEPVSYSQITERINAYDIGLYILPQDNINHKLALPNKIFEFLQARLAIVCSPNEAMKNLVNHYKIGCVAEGFETEDMKETLRRLTKEQIYNYKKQTQEVASVLSSRRDEDLILNTVKKILS